MSVDEGTPAAPSIGRKPASGTRRTRTGGIDVVRPPPPPAVLPPDLDRTRGADGLPPATDSMERKTCAPRSLASATNWLLRGPSAELVLERRLRVRSSCRIALEAGSFSIRQGNGGIGRALVSTLGTCTLSTVGTLSALSTISEEIDRVADQPRHRRRPRGAWQPDFNAVGAARLGDGPPNPVAPLRHFPSVAEEDQLATGRNDGARHDRDVGVVRHLPAHDDLLQARFDVEVEKRRAGNRVNRREDPALPDRVVDRAGVPRCVAGERPVENHAVAERLEARLIARDADQSRQAPARVLGAPADASMRVRRGQRHDRRGPW